MTADTTKPLIYLIAGEPSGDALGARLMAAIKAQAGQAVAFRGVGGPLMGEQGLDSRFPITDLAVMGLAEVLPRLPLLLRRIRETVDDIVTARPAVLVTIDVPDFSLRVARRVRDRGTAIPLVHYVAPSVWAWKPSRARKMAGYLDRVMTLLPFEPPYFERVGLAADFVGHSVLESGADRGDADAFRRRHAIGKDHSIVSLLPGSRAGEIERLMPVLKEIVRLLCARRDDLRFVLPTVSTMRERVAALSADWERRPLVLSGESEKYGAFAASAVAIAASGTVALELAMAGTPNVIIYRLNPLTAWIARRLITVKYGNLVNILLDEEAVPELIQEDCRADRIADMAGRLLGDQAFADAQKARFREALGMLRHGGLAPSDAAARVVLGAMKKGRS